MSEANESVKEGDMAPDFAMRDGNGKTSRLSELRGKRAAVVYFYPKDFTPGCTTEASEFTRDYEKFKAAGIEIVGISPDSEESHSKFRQKMGIPYQLVADTANDVSRKYGVFGPKNFMGREYMGVNRTTFLIDKTGRVSKVFKRVKPAGHSQEVFDLLA